MKEYETYLEKLDLMRASLRYDIDVMIVTRYSSVFLSKMQINLLAIEHNIRIVREVKPLHLKQISHLLLPVDDPIF